MDNASKCCGAAGIYSVVHREMSRQLLAGKIEAIAATGADTVATANPGCIIQIEAGVRMAGLPIRVRHVVELLDEAYGVQE
jgi:glycolate oxidase iron-sulfur subunit